MPPERRGLPRSSDLRIARIAFGSAAAPLYCLVWNASRAGLLVEPIPEDAVPAALRAVLTCTRLDGPIRVSRRARGIFAVELLAHTLPAEPPRSPSRS